MTIPICLTFMLFEQRRCERGVYAVATVFGVVCLLLTNSRAGLLALLAELGLVILVLRRKTLILGVAVFCVVIIGIEAVVVHYQVVALPGTTITVRGLGTLPLLHRFQIWQFTTKQIMLHPLFGIGYGKDNFRLVYGASSEPDPGKDAAVLPAGTHNIFLDLALGAGIPAAAVFIWLLWRIVTTALKNFQKATLSASKALTLGVAAGVIGMTVRLSFDQMLIGTLAVQFWIWVALCLSVQYSLDSDKTATVLNR